MTILKMINFDEFYDESKVVTNPNPLYKGEYSDDGVFSEKIFGAEDIVDNVDSMGWIDFGEDNYLISPLMYHRIARIIKPSYLDSIIQFNKRIDADGNFNDSLDDDDTSRTAKIPEANIGLYEFKERFIEILNKYAAKNERLDTPEYRNLIKWYLEGKVFINKFPIFSPKLRPAQINKDEKIFHLSEINTYYNFLITHSNNLKSIKGRNMFEDVLLQRSMIMYKLQLNILKVNNSIIESIKGKKGIIRKMVLAGRVNFSARNVIIPNPLLRMNEVILGYTTFLELYKLPLINLVSMVERITYYEAKKFVEQSQIEYSPKMYKYMKEFLHKSKNGVKVLINRNPSISIHSILLVKVKDIVDDIHNYTMQLSNNILSGLGADFDGDVLNIIALFGKSQHDQFRILDPYYQMVSRNDGNFNVTYSITKDAKLATHILSGNDKEKILVED